MGFEERVLCTDGGCIGLVGSDGRCRECGLVGPKGAAVAVRNTIDAADSADDDDDDDWDDEAAEEEEELGTFDELPDADDDFESRQLCSDGSCVGLIGAKGRCTTCGKPAGAGEEE